MGAFSRHHWQFFVQNPIGTELDDLVCAGFGSNELFPSQLNGASAFFALSIPAKLENPQYFHVT